MSLLTPPLETVEINPSKGSANMSVILLHGLGGSAKMLMPIAKIWNIKKGFRPRWILPQAPERPVSVNNGQVMPAWYDILSIDLEHRIDVDSVRSTLLQMEQLIEKEISRGILAKHILLAGFSQGGAVALASMLLSKPALAGIICLSGYLLDKKIIEEERYLAHAKQTPIFYSHGEKDTVVPYSFAQYSKNLLEKHNFNISWRSYPQLGHFVNNREILDVKKWVDQTILTEDI